MKQMRVRYSTLDSSHDEMESLPWLPIILRQGQHRVEAVGLVDSGATISVLPYELGVQLGAVWAERHAAIRLAGNLGNFPAIPLLLTAAIGDFSQVTLAFAWTQASRRSRGRCQRHPGRRPPRSGVIGVGGRSTDRRSRRQANVVRPGAAGIAAFRRTGAARYMASVRG